MFTANTAVLNRRRTQRGRGLMVSQPARRPDPPLSLCEKSPWSHEREASVKKGLFSLESRKKGKKRRIHKSARNKTGALRCETTAIVIRAKKQQAHLSVTELRSDSWFISKF